MLQFGLAKTISILAVVVIGLFLAMPNLFYERVERYNDAVRAEAAGKALTPEQQADKELWPSWLPSGIVNLGLDLRGGAYLLVEVQVEDVYGDIMDGIWPEVRDTLRKTAGVRTVRRQEAEKGELRVRIDNPDAVPAAISALSGLGGYRLDITDAGNGVISLKLAEEERRALDDRTVDQSLEKIRRRVDAAGTREPSIQRQGADRIVVQVPGLGSAEELKALIGKTAKLSFHPVIRAGSKGERVGPDELLLPEADTGEYLVVERAAVVGGEELVDAKPGFDRDGRPAVDFRFNAVGARKFGDYTRDNIGKRFAIVLDNEIISAPQIITHIPGGVGQITGRFTVQESNNLAILLRAGALPAGLRVLEERTVGPELGQDSVDSGRIASIIALVAVVIYMIASYGLFGIFASIALGANIGLIFGALSVLGATLTLPGIAGIVLTIGMAVDANVLIFERIREELRNTKGVARAIELGFTRALSAILDANITTLIAVVILYFVGSGPVSGFAVTLGIGVITSVFTAYYLTRLLMVAYLERTRARAITI
ncbi:MAG: protein translocase subunit SecD [Alphaproteobacteria bacterium]|nr:MAG: protein translocase subunit SecD [Alphaproteobacteria bacterium]